MDPGNNNRPRDVKPKVAVAKKKAKGAAAAPAPAPAPAAAAAIGNNEWNEESDFDILEKHIQRGSYKPIDEFMKSHKKFDVLAKDTKKGYSIWDLALFKGDKKIKEIIRKYRAAAYALALERAEELFEKVGKLTTIQNLQPAINAYFREEQRKRNEEIAAMEAKRKKQQENAERWRKEYEESARKAREEAEFMAKNFEGAVKKIEELIRAKVEDPADSRFQELLEMLKNGVDLRSVIMNPLLPPIPGYNRLHPSDPRIPNQKITLLELLTFFEDPLLVQVFDTLRMPVQNTNVRPAIRRENKEILDIIAEEAQKMQMGSQADKYRIGMKNALAKVGYYRTLEHFGIYYMGAESRESYEARQPKFMGKLTSNLINVKKLFDKTINTNIPNVKISMFDKLFETDKPQLQKLIDELKDKPGAANQIKGLLKNRMNTFNYYNHYNINTHEPNEFSLLSKLKYLLQNKLLSIDSEEFNFLMDKIEDIHEIAPTLLSNKYTKEEYCRIIEKYHDLYWLSRQLVLNGTLDIFDCSLSFMDYFSAFTITVVVGDVEVIKLLLNPKHINRVGPKGPLLSYILNVSFRSQSRQEFNDYDRLIQQFLAQGADINAPMPDGSSMLNLVKSASLADWIIHSDTFNLDFHLNSLLAQLKSRKITPITYRAVYECLVLYNTLHTPEETLALLETIPALQIQSSQQLKELKAALQQQIDSKKPYTGYSQQQLILLNEILYRPVDFSFCPVCLFATPRRDGCLYMRHDCRESGVYHEELYEKYKDWQGKITWCTMCSRICDSWQTRTGVAHRHFQLVPYSAAKPAHSAPKLGLENAFDKSCLNQGGGGLLEKFIRMRRLREYAFQVQDEVGKKSDKQVRKELIEEVWNSFQSRQPQAQKVLNRATVLGAEVLKAAQNRLKPLPTDTPAEKARKAKAEIELTDEEIVRLNSIWQTVGMNPTSAFPKGNELTAANRLAIAAQKAANDKLNANSKAASFPWPNAGNATKQPIGVAGECDVGLHEANPVWEFQHGLPMDTHGRICNDDLTDIIVNRIKTTSYRNENAVKCWSFPTCNRTLWPEEIRGKVPDDVYEQYRVFFNKYIITHGGKVPAQGGGRVPLDLDALPFFHTESASAQCSLPIWSQITITSKKNHIGRKTRRKNRK